jgi:RNA polymerase sigma factor (sigma-70 family)
MAQQDVEFADLMKRVQEGSQEAAKELHSLYGEHILRVVRYRLHQRLRSKFDSYDFVQDVWASFFTDIPHKHIFKSSQDLIGFLTEVARNKVAQAVRTRMQRQKFNVNREIPLDCLPEDTFPKAQGSPSEGLKDQEEWLKFLQKLPLVHRRIFLLWREGKSSATIAEELNISQRTVNRVVSKLFSGSPP